MSGQPKRISILGATGSVGQSTLDLVRRDPEAFSVTAITANTNIEQLVRDAIEFKADLAVVADQSKYQQLKDLLAGTDVKPLAGEDGLIAAADSDCDLLVAAIVGTAGLRPTLAAVRRGTAIALANKECLVCAGDLFISEANKSGAKILPIDSEHNAIYQVFDFERPEAVDRIILTASGGPFWNRRSECLRNVTPAEAVAHPNWDMGQKISVDSATLMNKGLEVIEAYYLFPVSTDQLDVVIHRESVIHSMVEYCDGSVLAQLGSPDMRTPISYALAWPNRIKTPVERLSLPELGKLTFANPDTEAFPCLQLAMDSLQEGGSAPLILNAANEIAVAAFLKNKLRFTDISSLVKATLAKCDMKAPQSLSMVFEQDAEARRIADGLIRQFEI